MQKMNLLSYRELYPTINELEGFGISVLTGIAEAPCANCNGTGKDCERPCKPCHLCEGRGKADVPTFAVGVPACPIRATDERILSPQFEELSHLEAHALANRDALLATESPRHFAI